MKNNFDSFSDKFINLFSSVKLSVIILLLLAGTSAIGTIIPQGESAKFYFFRYGESLFRIFDALDLFDMYHSWWFLSLHSLLCMNIVVCTVKKLEKKRKSIFNSAPTFNFFYFSSLENKRELLSKKPINEILELYKKVAAKFFAYSKTEKKEDGYIIFAEKGRWGGVGVHIVHISVILLLLGFFIGALFGFEGFVTIPEGESVKEVPLTKRNQVYKLGFEVKCEKFGVEFYEDGSPKEYKSDLTIIKNGKKVLEKSIVVNDPLRYKGINFFQSSYGIIAPKSVTLSLTSSDSQMVYFKKAKMNETIDLPEDGGKFIIKDFSSSYEFGGRNIGGAFLISIVRKNGEETSAIIPVEFERFDMMRKGKFVIAVDSYDKLYYTGLQVTSDPGVPIIYAGFIFILVGCFIVFFVYLKRVCIYIESSGKKTKISISGTSEKNNIGIERMIDDLCRKASDR